MTTAADRLCDWCEGGTLDRGYGPTMVQFRQDLRAVLRQLRWQAKFCDEVAGLAYDREKQREVEEIAAGIRAVQRLKEITEENRNHGA